jgi:hypothetical protein
MKAIGIAKTMAIITMIITTMGTTTITTSRPILNSIKKTGPAECRAYLFAMNLV